MTSGGEKPRMTFRGHLRAFGFALIFGLAAYTVINLLITLARSLGSRL